jgi:hypothetical protein
MFLSSDGIRKLNRGKRERERDVCRVLLKFKFKEIGKLRRGANDMGVIRNKSRERK